MPLQLACTQKLLKEFKVSPAKANKPDNALAPLTIWYAHLFYVSRKKCLIMVNLQTGYHVFALFLSRERIQTVAEWFPGVLRQSFQEDGFSRQSIESTVSGLDSLAICRTDSRSVLGHINDSLRSIDYYLSVMPPCDTPMIELRLAEKYNRGPCGPKMSFPSQNMAMLLNETDRKSQFL